MDRVRDKKIMFRRLALVITLLLVATPLCACDSTDTLSNEVNAADDDSADLREYIEQTYGFADNPIYGTHVTHTETGHGSTSITYDEKIKEGSQGGAVSFKEVSPDENTEGLVCTYLSEEENNGILFKAAYHYTNAQGSSAYIITLEAPTMQPTPTRGNRCYAIIGNDVFASAHLFEQEDISSKDESVYTENITVYRLTGTGMKELYTINRTVESNEKELKNFVIQNESERIIYAAGYNSYTAEGAEFVSTQQEFCDRANNLLKNSALDCITLNKTSWNNRWYGINVDESGIGKDIAKVDFSFSEATIAENGDEVRDITIKINDEQPQEENVQLEEIEDIPVTYNQNTATTPQESIVMPEYIPQTVDVNELQDLRYFNIDGFWHSADKRYVYYIYTQHPDSGFGTLYFADLEGSAEAKHGQVKQTSSYSVILKAMEDNVFSPEVFAANNQLVSDEIVLERVDDSIVSNLLGTWTNEDVTYSFDTDGNYHVKTSEDSDWGKYFVIDKSEVVLGERVDDLKLWPYKIEGDTLTINDSLSLKRQ